MPESTTAYTVHMSSAASESSNLGTATSEVTPAPEPEQPRPQGIERLQLPEDYRIFYPKKIHAFVENFLSAEPMNTDIFIRWWCQTRLSKDFWIENKSQLIRVHIVPRRGLFSPSDWVTTQGEVKDRLLGVVGPVRTTNGISCQSHHPLQNLHDVWEDEVGQGFPTLWIGRTVFSRRAVSVGTSSLPSSAVDLHGSPSPQEDQPVEDEQSPAHGQSRGAGLPGPLHVDSGRDSAGGGGEDQRAGGCGQHPQGPRFDDIASAPGHLPRNELGDAECTDEGAAATSHSDSAGSPANTIVPFGRHRGRLYKEVPDSYLRWCMEESRVNRDNASPDLIRLANYATMKFQSTPVYDPEINSKVPYNPSETDSKFTEWSVASSVPPRSKGYGAPQKDLPHLPKQKAQQKRRGQGETGTERMSQDVRTRSGRR